MKRIWKTRRNEEAVSPVIATILMVAITVVLAAVLYVMVIGFGGGGQNAPPGNFSPITVQSNTQVKITFGTFSPIPKPMDMKVILTPAVGTVATVELPFSSQPVIADTNISWGADAGEYAIYHDFNYQGNQINSGDYFTVYGLTANTNYEIAVYHAPSQSLCPLPGQTPFATPP